MSKSINTGVIALKIVKITTAVAKKSTGFAHQFVVAFPAPITKLASQNKKSKLFTNLVLGKRIRLSFATIRRMNNFSVRTSRRLRKSCIKPTKRERFSLNDN